MSFPLYLCGFPGKKSEVFLTFEYLENTMKKECFFREKNVLIFLKTFFKKWEGANYAGGSWPSCYKWSEQFIEVILREAPQQSI